MEYIERRQQTTGKPKNITLICLAYSLLATSNRTYDLVAIASTTIYTLPDAVSLERLKGATFDISRDFYMKIHENYQENWFQIFFSRCYFVVLIMLLVFSLPENSIRYFNKHPKENGVNIFRVFDELKVLDQLRVGVLVVKKVDGIVGSAICYSGNI